MRRRIATCPNCRTCHEEYGGALITKNCPDCGTRLDLVYVSKRSF